MQNKYIHFLSLPTYLLPLALLTGPFIPDLIISLSTIIFVYLTIKRKDFIYFKNVFFYIFILFYIYLIFCSLISSDTLFSLKSSIFYFRFGIFSLFIWYLINNNEKFIEIFTYIFICTFLCALIDGHIQFFFNNNLIGLETDGGRLRLAFDDEPILGSYLSRLFPFLLGLIIILKINKKFKFFLIASISLLTINTILFSGERTAFGIVIIGIIMLLFFINHFFKIRLFLIIALLALVTTVIIIFSSVSERMIDRTFMQITNNDPNTKLEKVDFGELNFDFTNLVIFSPEHHSLIMSANKMFLDSPFFGHGPNVFRKKCNLDEFAYDDLSCSTHPHNTYIQILAEIGFIGSIPIMFIFIFLLYRIFEQKKIFSNSNIKDAKELSDYQICLVITIILTLWPFFPTQNFFNNWINIIYYLPVGFYLQSLVKKNNI